MLAVKKLGRRKKELERKQREQVESQDWVSAAAFVHEQTETRKALLLTAIVCS